MSGANESHLSTVYDVLIEGGYFCDLIFTGLPGMPRLGAEIVGAGFEMVPGANFYYALAFKRLGLRVGWSCDFGNDLFSRFVLDMARREGLDDSLFRVHDFPLRCLTVSLSFPNERAFVTYTDEVAGPPLLALVRQYRPRCVLLGGLAFGPDHLELVTTAHEVGALVYMDCQSHQTTLDNPQVIESLRAVDIFAPNEGEALALTGATTVTAALARLAELTGLVIIKRGSRGAIAQTSQQVICAPGLKVEAFDTTGAGDCFNTGFLYGYLRGDPLETCLKYGNICGGLSTTDHGAAAAPTAAEVEVWLQRYPELVNGAVR
ncbi:MAG: carbohydrate kinase family protein [Chloroflexota bacterium]